MIQQGAFETVVLFSRPKRLLQISFRIDWFDLAAQGTLKSPLQHYSSKASILWCSAWYIGSIEQMNEDRYKVG